MRTLAHVSRAVGAAFALSMLLLAGGAMPARAQSCTGSTTITDSLVANTPPFQTGRLTQNGVASNCASAKTFPGVADTNMRSVKIYNFANNNDATACITVTLNAQSCVGTAGLFSAAYSAYNPGDISMGYLADIGASPNPSRSYSFNVPAHGDFQVVVYQTNINQSCASYTLTVSGFGCLPLSQMLISEFRFSVESGQPNANLDEYIELYNNTDTPLLVATTDGSAGWALAGADGVVRFTIPNGTVIPAGGHYLGVNSVGYSLASYPAGNGTTATGDATYMQDIPLVSGVALFNTANPANFSFATRLDAVGFVGVPALYREAGLTSFPVSSGGTNFIFVRRLATGLPQDTGDNARDFVLTSLVPDSSAIYGAPGPENLSSPTQRNATIKATYPDPASPASCTDAALACARVRDTTANPGNFSTFGTLSLRRRFTNNTGAPVTRLRFRVVDITTLTGGGSLVVPAGTADLRVLSSPDINVTTAGGGMLAIKGLTREEPPTQFQGGGLNTSLAAGSVTLAQPLLPGGTIDVQFLVGVQQQGSYRFFVNVEALNTVQAPTAPQKSPRKLPAQALKLSGRADN